MLVIKYSSIRRAASVLLIPPPVTSDPRPGRLRHRDSTEKTIISFLWVGFTSSVTSSTVTRGEAPNLFFSLSLLFVCLFVCRWLPLRMRKGREREGTRTLTTCSSCWSSATAAWARRRSCSATPTTPSPRPSSAPWASTSKSRRSTRTTRGSNCRSGWGVLRQTLCRRQNMI